MGRTSKIRKVCQIAAVVFVGVLTLNSGKAQPVMIVHDLQNSGKDRKYRTPEQARAALRQHAVQHPVFVDVSPTMSIPRQDYATITVYRTEDRLLWFLHSLDPNLKAPQPVEIHTIKLPEEAIPARAEVSFEGCEVSPDQKFVMYDVNFSLKPPLVRKPIREELWVSRADGQGLHKLGYVLPGKDEQDVYNSQLLDVHWLPDSKQISFFFQGVDYVLNARREPSP